MVNEVDQTLSDLDVWRQQRQKLLDEALAQQTQAFGADAALAAPGLSGLSDLDYGLPSGEEVEAQVSSVSSQSRHVCERLQLSLEECSRVASESADAADKRLSSAMDVNLPVKTPEMMGLHSLRLQQLMEEAATAAASDAQAREQAVCEEGLGLGDETSDLARQIDGYTEDLEKLLKELDSLESKTR